jgi:hypothetical protein
MYRDRSSTWQADLRTDRPALRASPLIAASDSYRSRAHHSDGTTAAQMIRAARSTMSIRIRFGNRVSRQAATR